jgi:hypothetical protein
MSTNHVSTPDVTEIVAITDPVSGQSHLVDLASLDPTLRSLYHSASRRVARHQSAQATMGSVARQILEAQGVAAIKAARPIRGNRAVAETLMKIRPLKD